MRFINLNYTFLVQLKGSISSTGNQKYAQYSKLSHLNSKTDTKGSTNWPTFSIAFSGFTTGNGTH